MTDKEFLRDMNDILDEWQGRSKPSEIKEVESLLKDFYEDAGKNIKNPKRFNTRVKLSPEQQEELMDIALSLQAREEDLEYYEDFYKKNKKKYGFESMDDVTEFFEEQNAYKNDALLREIISSDQIAELYREGKTNNLSKEDIDNMIAMEYTLTGVTFDKLYERILDSISEIDAEKFSKEQEEINYLSNKWRGR